MKKLFSTLTLMLCMSLCASAIDVDLEKGEPGLNPFPGGRSETENVTASIDANVLTVLFSDLTSSQIIVTDSTNQTVFYQNYAQSYSAQANLSLLPDGNYTLHIYAFGWWWCGYFEIE